MTHKRMLIVRRRYRGVKSFANGKVLIARGTSQPTGQGLASAELYDPSTGSFSATGSMSVPRISHTATLLPDGRVLIAGGFAGANQTTAGAIATAELYDP